MFYEIHRLQFIKKSNGKIVANLLLKRGNYEEDHLESKALVTLLTENESIINTNMKYKWIKSSLSH